MTVITTLVREKHLHISPVNCCFLESNIEKNPILVLWLYSKKEELKKHSVWSTLKDVTAGVRLWQNYTVNSRKSHRFWIVCMCVYSVCVRVWSRKTLTHRLLLSPSFHPSLFSWAAAVDSFNGKFKQTTPPFSPSHFPPCLLFFGPLSLSISLSSSLLLTCQNITKRFLLSVLLLVSLINTMERPERERGNEAERRRIEMKSSSR